METPWMLPGNIEFFVNGNDVFFMQDGTAHPFGDLSLDLLDVLATDLESHPEAEHALDDAKITDPIERLKRYAKCRYGDFDGSPDIINGKIKDQDEYFACGVRGRCKYEGKLCSPLKAMYGVLTKAEIEVMRFAATDNSDKEIANTLHRSQYTISKHIQHILEKLGAKGRIRIGVFASKHNIL